MKKLLVIFLSLILTVFVTALPKNKVLAKDSQTLVIYSWEDYLDLGYEEEDLEDLSELEEPNNIKISFGKHKGRTLEEIYKDDKSYFMWLKNNEKTDEKLRKACEEVLVSEDVSKVGKEDFLNQ